MSNKNNKNRSIFERRGFYAALYSCIGVVLVLAIGISINSMNQSATDMFGRQTTAQPSEQTALPRAHAHNDGVMEEVRVEEASIRDILPILPRLGDEALPEASPEVPAEPPQESTPPESSPEPPQVERAPVPPPEPEPAPQPGSDAALTYVPEVVPVMQPGDAYAIVAADEPDLANVPVNVTTWHDDPLVTAHDNILADPVFNIFSGNTDMGWPVRGDIVMGFSMDSLIHDVTLNQFRTNDKISIQAHIGTQVRAASDGVVRSVEHDRRLGNTVVIEHGNGWFTTYSQLQDHILVAVGDVVVKDQVIGGVGVPSIFYTLLGSHLSFRVVRDDVAVNPLMVLGH